MMEIERKKNSGNKKAKRLLRDFATGVHGRRKFLKGLCAWNIFDFAMAEFARSVIFACVKFHPGAKKTLHGTCLQNFQMRKNMCKYFDELEFKFVEKKVLKI